MYKKIVNSLYLINIIFQAFFSLLFPVGCALLLAWYMVEKRDMPSWLYVILIVLGVFIGLFSMVKFILSAMSAFERLEKEQKAKEKHQEGKRGKQKTDE